MEYQLEELKDKTWNYGVIKHYYYKVLNYDGNYEKLKEYIKKLNDDSCFNVDYHIKELNYGDNNEVIIEETYDTLD